MLRTRATVGGRQGPPCEGGDLLVAQLARAATGDQSAVRDIHTATYGKLYAVAIRILYNRQACEDVLQEVYLSVWRRCGDYDPQFGSPMGWMTTIVRNRAIDHLRANKVARLARGLDDAQDVRCSRPSPLDVLEMKELLGLIDDRLGARRPLARAALYMSLIDGLTYKVIAETFNIPEGTTKSIIRRSLADIRAALGSRIPDGPVRGAGALAPSKPTDLARAA